MYISTNRFNVTDSYTIAGAVEIKDKMAPYSLHVLKAVDLTSGEAFGRMKESEFDRFIHGVVYMAGGEEVTP